MITIKGSNSLFATDCNECYFDMHYRKESNITKLPSDSIQNTHGVYVFFGWDDEPIRIGKAVKLRNRILQYGGIQSGVEWEHEVQFVGVIYTNGMQESSSLELDLIKTNQPKYNVHGK